MRPRTANRDAVLLDVVLEFVGQEPDEVCHAFVMETDLEHMGTCLRPAMARHGEESAAERFLSSFGMTSKVKGRAKDKDADNLTFDVLRLNPSTISGQEGLSLLKTELGGFREPGYGVRIHGLVVALHVPNEIKIRIKRCRP